MGGLVGGGGGLRGHGELPLNADRSVCSRASWRGSRRKSSAVWRAKGGSRWGASWEAAAGCAATASCRSMPIARSVRGRAGGVRAGNHRQSGARREALDGGPRGRRRRAARPRRAAAQCRSLGLFAGELEGFAQEIIGSLAREGRL